MGLEEMQLSYSIVQEVFIQIKQVACNLEVIWFLKSVVQPKCVNVL